MKTIFIISIISLLLLSSSLAVNGALANTSDSTQNDDINGPGGLMSLSGSPVQTPNPDNPLQIKAHHPAHVKKFIGPSVTLSGGESPANVWSAYGFNKLVCTHTTTTDWTDPNLCGHGQTIAIVDAYDDPNIASDLQTFDSQFGLPSCTVANGCFTKKTQGTPATDSGWALEMSLDVQWAHSIAPGAKIILVESSDNTYGNLLAGVDTAVGTGAQQISASWGGNEFSTETTYDYHFSSTTASFYAASGDSGHGVIWPAASPYVVSVGGTTLTTDGSGNWVSESAWSGSGGGTSSYEPKPSYQNNFNSNSKRTVPDVAYDGDPNTGFYVYDSVPLNGNSGWWVVGGTSAGAPQWASISAIANSQNAKLVSASFGANSELYHAGNGSQSSPQTKPYLANYHDIITGNDGSCGSICNAIVGYDQVTGLGSPQSNNIVPYVAPGGILSDSLSCNAIGGAWNGSHTCTVTSLTINSGETLTIASNIELYNSGTITINSGGTINNFGTINNSVGTIINSGTIDNECGGIITGSISGNPIVNLPCDTITLNPISSVPWGNKIIVSGKMVDQLGRNVSNATISFNGTGGSSITNTTTDVNGLFNATGTAPATVQAGWTVQAHFTGNSILNSSDSSIITYSTTSHNTSLSLVAPANVPWGRPTSFNATLTDTTVGGAISARTISFTGTGVIGVSNTNTGTTGVATGTGTAPSTVTLGWTAQAHFAGDTLYTAVDSSVQTFSTVKHSLSLALAVPANVPWSRPTSFTATLTDNSAGTVLSARTISFTGTGVIGVSNTNTGTTGVATGHGTSPSTVATGWTAQAHYSGNTLYNSADSPIQTYSTVKHSVSLALTKPANVPWGRPTAFNATLTDNSAGKIALSARTISFTGTGVMGVTNVTTGTTGVAIGIGTSPSTVATGWKAQANYAGDTLYNSASSSMQTYNTLVHSTSLTLALTPSIVLHSTSFNVNGSLTDTTANVLLGSRTITFTATTPITIPGQVTSAAGVYSVSRTAPDAAGSYNIIAHSAASSLYGASTSPTRTLNVS